MSTVYYPHEGQARMLAILFGSSSVVDCKLRLFSNDATISVDSQYNVTTKSVTECTQTGYGAITLSRGSWTIVPGGAGIERSYITYAQQTFTWIGYSGSGEFAYGYFITFELGGSDYRLILAEKFARPQRIHADNSINITPRIYFNDLTIAVTPHINRQMRLQESLSGSL